MFSAIRFYVYFMIAQAKSWGGGDGSGREEERALNQNDRVGAEAMKQRSTWQCIHSPKVEH